MIYDLYGHIARENITILEGHIPIDNMNGLYFDNTIIIDSSLETEVDKNCIIAEEIGHHETTVGNILDQTLISNIKQESKGRIWAFEKLLPVDRFIDAYKKGCSNRYETALFLEVNEKFLEDALIHYKRKHGPFMQINEYTIYFNPLGVLRSF